MKLKLLPVNIDDPAELDTALNALIKSRIDAFTVFRDSLLLVHSRRFVEFAAKNRLPAVYDGREFAFAGGLMSYTSNHLDLYKRAASFVVKILKGAKPADLPVEQTMRPEFVINLTAAHEIGLTIPAGMLQRADKVIR
jgi:putative ABC transport system substrate-binding protein